MSDGGVEILVHDFIRSTLPGIDDDILSYVVGKTQYFNHLFFS